MPETPETTTEVPDRIWDLTIEADAQYDLTTPAKDRTWKGRQNAIIAAVLPAARSAERAKVAEELRADADAHRRLIARKPSQHDEARLARARTLDDAAALARGEQP